jgi:large subunit ribosomal protein L17
MRHLKTGRKFNRNSTHRYAMWRNMTTSLIVHERIKTTNEKAKELRHYVEKMVTIAKRARALGENAADTSIAARKLHLRRQALAFVRDKDAVTKLFDELAARFADRSGGYTRIIKVGDRIGDGARVSFIEFLAADEEVAEKSKKSAAKRRGKPKVKAEAEKAAPAPAEEPAPAAPDETVPVETPPAAEEPTPEEPKQP